MKPSTRNNLIFTASVLSFLVIWQLLSSLMASPIVLPSPGQVLTSLISLSRTTLFWLSLKASFYRVLAAFFISIALGIFLGAASGLSKSFEAFIRFPLSLVRSTPVVALIMIMLFWFPSKAIPVICAVLMTLPVMHDAVSKALRLTNPKLLEMCRIFHVSFRHKLTGLYIPSCKPYVLGASRTVFSQSWKVVAAGEILSLPRNALGTLIQDNRLLMESSKVFALVLSLTAFCILSEKLIFAILRILSDFIGVTLARLNRARVGSFAAPAFASDQQSLRPAVSGSLSARRPATAPDAFAVSVENLTFSYKPDSKKSLCEEQQLFSNFSVNFDPLHKNAILAATGRGKTTLLNILSGLIKPDYGKISCSDVSFIFQDDRLLPGVSVLQNVALPLFSFMHKKDALLRAFRYLEQVGLSDRAFDFPENLSGGEKQKVQASRAFAYETPVLLMDEGTSSLDAASKAELWNTIQCLFENNPRTLIFVTHDEAEAQKYADKVIHL